MFSKAPLKRFNEKTNETPGPLDYDPQAPKSRGAKVAVTKSERFQELKSDTPGPGSYDTDEKPKIKAKVPSFKNRKSLAPPKCNLSKASSKTSLTSSTNSLYTEVEADDDIMFKTPNKLPTKKLVIDPALEEKITQLNQELEAKNEVIFKIELDKETLETKVKEVEKELELIKDQKVALEDAKKELEGKNDDLEKDVVEAKNALENEKKTLDEKSTFLHFTQEQLNVELDGLRSQCDNLNKEVESLKALLALKEKELKEEKEKVEELTQVYIKENNDSESEFKVLQSAKLEVEQKLEKIKSEKDDLAETNLNLHAKIEELNLKMEELEKTKSVLDAKFEEVNADCDVFANDKLVLEQELKRIEHEKNELALDLASVQAAKNDFEAKFQKLENDKEVLIKQTEDLLAEKEDLKVVQNKYEELKMITDEQMTELEAREVDINAFKLEIQELEMKNSSLEGTLCSTQGELANLSSENKSLMSSFEKIEDSIRGYIHQNQDLNDHIDELEGIKQDLNETCVILEQRMLSAEENVCNLQEDMVKLLHEIERKDAIIEELSLNVDDLETKNIDLEALVELLEERHTKTEELLEETKIHYEKMVGDLKLNQKTLDSNLEAACSDASQLRSDKADLIDMNENLSNQISEQLMTIKKLQDHEQDLMSKLENAKRDLELAHTGMTSELHKQWAAEDEILNLQNALDESEIKVQDAKAEIVRLNKKIQDKVTIDAKLENQFEQLSVNYINAQAELELKNEELAKVKKNLAKKTESVKVAELEIKAKKELEKKIQHLEKDKNKLKNDLEIKAEEISSLNISLSTQQKLIQEHEKEVAKIKYQLNQAEKSACKMDEIQNKMVDQEDEIQKLKVSQQSHEKELQDKDKVIQILRQELDPLQENAQSYKEKYEALSRLVEPFREQLENYEVERNALVAQKKEAQGQVEDLATKYAQLLGHQNHKQKIHHLVKLKQDNLDLRTELAKVNLDLNKQKRLVARYKGSKENSHPDLLKTPMSAMKTPSIRRQTIASPLSNRNGQR